MNGGASDIVTISTVELPRLPQYCSDCIGITARGFLADATGYSDAVGEAVDAAVAAGVESNDILGLSARFVTTYSPAALTLTPRPTPTWDTGLLLTLIATRSFTLVYAAAAPGGGGV